MSQDTNQGVEQVIDTLACINPEVTLNDGTKVSVGKVKVGHLSHMIRVVNKVIARLGVKADGQITVDLSDPANILSLLSELPDEVALMLSLLTSIPPEKIALLDADDGIALLTKVVEVNRDFFIRSVKPKLDELMRQVKGLS